MIRIGEDVHRVLIYRRAAEIRLARCELNPRQVIAELELLSHGSCQAWNPAGGHGGEPAGLPPGDKHVPHLYWAQRLRDAGVDERAIAKVAAGAKAELDAWRGRVHHRPEGETAAEFDARIVREGDGWEADKVAFALRTTSTRVRKARQAAGRDVASGKTISKAGDLTDLERRAKARELRDANLSIRQIAARLGVGLATVHRDLAASANVSPERCSDAPDWSSSTPYAIVRNAEVLEVRPQPDG